LGYQTLKILRVILKSLGDLENSVWRAVRLGDA